MNSNFNITQAEINKLILSRDNSSLDIYVDNGEGEPKHICYWNSDEWEEDPETVVPAMMEAIDLFYTDKNLLVKTLGFVICD